MGFTLERPRADRITVALGSADLRMVLRSSNCLQ
jgi:hypothetical protein